MRDAEVAVDPTQHEHPSNLYVSLHTRQDVRADEHEQQLHPVEVEVQTRRQHPVQINEGLMLLSSEDDRLGSSPPTARLLAPIHVQETRLSEAIGCLGVRAGALTLGGIGACLPLAVSRRLVRPSEMVAGRSGAGGWWRRRVHEVMGVWCVGGASKTSPPR